MPFLRLVIVFALFAFSFARAQQLNDFEVLANGVSKGSSSSISVETVYGDGLILSVSPATGTFEWISSYTLIETGITFSPEFKFLEGNPLANIPVTYQVVRKEDNKSKTIIVTIISRPSYAVYFDTDGGTPTISDQNVLKDSLAQEPTETLTKTGHNFDGWLLNGSKYNFNTPVTGAITLTANWKIIEYTVSFTDGVGEQKVKYNYTATEPTPPTKADYDFAGWLLNGSKYSFSTPVTGSINLVSSWVPHPYNITYIDKGTCASCPESYTINDLPITLSTPTRIGYNFKGWFEDSSYLVVATIPIVSTGNKTFYAKWDTIPYTITYTPNGGTMIPASPPDSYDVTKTITLPTFEERCGYRFDGWFEDSSFSAVKTEIAKGSTGNKDFYAKWTKTPNQPTINLLSYPPLSASNKTYNSFPIDSIKVNPKPDNKCQIGVITVLYNDGINDATEPPKNAGTYQVYASISQNDNYTAEKIPLGSVTISKANATFSVSATVSNKEYDGTTTATIKDTVFTPTSTIYGDKLTTSDYFISAEFDNPNAGENKTISLSVTQSDNGPLFKNYKIDFQIITPMPATITKAKNTVLEIEAKDYDLSSPIPPRIVVKSPYIKDSDVRYEYKRVEEDETSYVSTQPKKVGNWNVRAIVVGDDNYEGKTTEPKIFIVTRGNATTVIHNIEFSEDLHLDSAMSDSLRRYYVAGANLCKIENARMLITIKEDDIILRIKNIPQRDTIAVDVYDYIFNFGKPGLDTLIYELLSKDNKYSEFDTILIETPIPFEAVVRQKWNNILFVNNNPQTNGDYKFTDFKWFKNNDEAGDMQFYSAGPSSTDTLNTDDVYRVVMHTANGIRISTCEGNAIIKVPAQALKPAFKKQVLGIKEKSLNSTSKIYNLNGRLTKETSAGVYIVEE